MKVTPVFERFLNHLEYLGYNIEEDNDGVFLVKHECLEHLISLGLDSIKRMRTIDSQPERW